MSEHDHELGVIGLGQMGGNIAKQADEKGIRVVGNAPSEHEEIQERGIPVYDPDEMEEMVAELSTPRAFYLSVPAGELVDETVEKLVEHCDEGDVIMDGGNSFWRDSMRRAEYVHDHGMYFMDTGSSGGLPGARDGGCFMVGGPEEGFEIVEPILDALSVEGGLVHTGRSGSGHFVKLVHNGIEFGMLQSIAEGVELLEAGEFDLDQQAVFENWNSGSVIRSWLVELMAKGLAGEFDETIDEPPESLDDVPPHIEDTGEVNWLVQEAFKGETPIPVISQSVIELFKSRGNQEHAPRAVSLMRRGFGNHPMGEDEYIAEERLTGRQENEARSTLHEQDDDREVVNPTDRDVFEDDED
ncbi:NADP-dependent phosphogluconate dehydrogenase [Halobium salinum]|uniref:NADP-dependent phosphogluconate dehydrogenase n=1 Tax=Halobium salinum TaxID=1364940 RepID=A0ABD5PDD1_9EURY|nr:NADP-dependent phosphogluconate dehydrogenase [Halobium salinum]